MKMRENATKWGKKIKSALISLFYLKFISFSLISFLSLVFIYSSFFSFPDTKHVVNNIDRLMQQVASWGIILVEETVQILKRKKIKN